MNQRKRRQEGSGGGQGREQDCLQGRNKYIKNNKKENNGALGSGLSSPGSST